MKDIVARIQREPALIVGFVSAVIALAAAFGFSLTAEQVGAIMAFVVALLAIILRQKVVPAKAVMAYQTIQGEVVTGQAAPPEGDPAAVVTSDDGTGL